MRRTAGTRGTLVAGALVAAVIALAGAGEVAQAGPADDLPGFARVTAFSDPGDWVGGGRQREFDERMRRSRSRGRQPS